MKNMMIKYENDNILIAVILATIVILFAIIVTLMLNLNIIQVLTMSWALTTIYSLFTYFVIDSKRVGQINSEVILEKPVEVIREVPIQIPIENKTIEVVERIVTKEVPVYIRETRTREKSNILKYKYLASSETKTYHTKKCRFGKLIKKKYKIQSNNPAFFKKKHFKACKMCINKKI